MNKIPSKNRSIILSSLVGSLVEFYDLLLYGFFAPIISQLFFPTATPIIALINTFVIFSLGYLARPLGGLVLGYMQDRYGRKYILSFSILMMTIATFTIGCLPTYQQAGYLAPLLLLFARLVQGFSASGEICSAVIFVYEHTHERQQRWLCIAPLVGVCLGMLLGAVITFIITQISSPQNLLTIGWRIPFWLCVFPGIIGGYIRTRIAETPVFLANQTAQVTQQLRWREAFANNKIAILFLSITSSFTSAVFYLLFIFVPANLSLANQALGHSVKLVAGGLCIYMAVLLIFAILTTRYSRKIIFCYSNLVLVLSAVFLFIPVIDHSRFFLPAYLILVALSAAVVAPLFGWWAEIFPAKYRATNYSFFYNISNMIAGGTVPLLATYFLHIGLHNGPGSVLALLALSNLLITLYCSAS